MAVRGGAREGGGVLRASQPLPSGDPDVRPRLLLDHFLYFVVDLLKAVPFHHSWRTTAKATIISHSSRHEGFASSSVRAYLRNTPGSLVLV